MVIQSSSTSLKQTNGKEQPKMAYFFTPSTEYTSNVTILGNILANPTSPIETLNADQSYNFPAVRSVATYSKTDWKSELNTPNSLYVRYLETIAGPGVCASIRHNPRNAEEYGFRTLETLYLNPFEVSTYIEQSLGLDDSWASNKPLYIITELKIVRGGRLTSGSNNINAGGDYVFAYRVSQFRLKKSTDSATGFEVDVIDREDAVTGIYGEDELINVVDDDGDPAKVIMPLVYVM
ncbi:hypothetical protein BDV96DRAFT_644303 [Lophiotrema nucula]|uniref:Uncharacterized protein n=1 Tax=Lophiotrema nucula TaxID=690887 RepID=A0A6A5ZEP5_9PLEO|nr:hypothetical protein BDV96DRAFT_644303 [Lophiotrema nucula]